MDMQAILQHLQTSYTEMQQSREATLSATRAAQTAAASANAAREENADNGDRIRTIQTQIEGLGGLIQQMLSGRGGGGPPGGGGPAPPGGGGGPGHEGGGGGGGGGGAPPDPPPGEDPASWPDPGQNWRRPRIDGLFGPMPICRENTDKAREEHLTAINCWSIQSLTICRLHAIPNPQFDLKMVIGAVIANQKVGKSGQPLQAVVGAMNTTQMNSGQFASITDWFTKILLYCCGAAYSTVALSLFKQVKQSPDEDCLRFFMRAQLLFNQAYEGRANQLRAQGELCHQLQKGLRNEELAKAVCTDKDVMANKTDYSLLLATAQRFEAGLESFRNIRRGTSFADTNTKSTGSSKSGNGGGNSGSSGTSSAAQTAPEPMDIDVNKVQRPKRGRGGNRGGRGQVRAIDTPKRNACFGCGSTEHWIRDCTKENQGNQGGRGQGGRGGRGGRGGNKGRGGRGGYQNRDSAGRYVRMVDEEEEVTVAHADDEDGNGGTTNHVYTITPGDCRSHGPITGRVSNHDENHEVHAEPEDEEDLDLECQEELPEESECEDDSDNAEQDADQESSDSDPGEPVRVGREPPRDYEEIKASYEAIKTTNINMISQILRRHRKLMRLVNMEDSSELQFQLINLLYWLSNPRIKPQPMTPAGEVWWRLHKTQLDTLVHKATIDPYGTLVSWAQQECRVLENFMSTSMLMSIIDDTDPSFTSPVEYDSLDDWLGRDKEAFPLIRRYAAVRDLKTPLEVALSIRPSSDHVRSQHNRFREPWYIRHHRRYTESRPSNPLREAKKREGISQPDGKINTTAWPPEEQFIELVRKAMNNLYEAPSHGVDPGFHYWNLIDRLEELESQSRVQARKLTSLDTEEVRRTLHEDSEEDQVVPGNTGNVGSVYATGQTTTPSNQKAKQMFVKANLVATADAEKQRTVWPLIDTGNLSGYCLIDADLFNSLADKARIVPTRVKLFSASNQPLTIIGRTEKKILIELVQENVSPKKRFHYHVRPLVVRNLNVDILLSNSDVVNMKASITPHLSQLTLPTKTSQIEVPLVAREQKYTADRKVARAWKSITIKGNTVKNVPVTHGLSAPAGTHIVLEGNDGFQTLAPDHHVQCIPSLDEIKEGNINNISWIRVINRSQKDLDLQKGWEIGMVTTLEEEQKETISLIQTDVQNRNDLVAHLTDTTNPTWRNTSVRKAKQLTEEELTEPKTRKELYDRIHTDLAFDTDNSGLTEQQKKDICNIMADKRPALSLNYGELARVQGVEMAIPTGDAAPVRVKGRPTPVHAMDFVSDQVKRWTAQDVIEKRVSPWNAPLLVVPKANGGYRLCVDYRQLNAVTLDDARGVANLQTQISKVRGDPTKKLNFFGSLDLSEAFHSVPIRKEDVEKTGFYVPGYGACVFKRMPFGLKSAPSTFHEITLRLEEVMKESNPDTTPPLLYFDDILLTSETWEDFKKKLTSVLDAIIKIGLKVQVRKANFSTKQLKWLGHILCADGLKPDPDRTKALENWPTPKNVKDVAGLHGLLNTFSRWIPMFATRVKNIRALLKRGQNDFKTPVNWTKECENEKKEVIKLLTSQPIMGHVDTSEQASPLIVSVDTSKSGIGATLSQFQQEHNREVILHYASQKLTEAERAYSSYKLELLGLKEAVLHWQDLLAGRPFIVRTDHRALLWLQTSKNTKKPHLLMRWQEYLGHFSFKVEYLPAARMKLPDALSRRPYSNYDWGNMNRVNSDGQVRGVHIDPPDPEELPLEAAQTLDDDVWIDTLKRKRKVSSPTSDTVAAVYAPDEPEVAGTYVINMVRAVTTRAARRKQRTTPQTDSNPIDWDTVQINSETLQDEEELMHEQDLLRWQRPRHDPPLTVPDEDDQNARGERTGSEMDTATAPAEDDDSFPSETLHLDDLSEARRIEDQLENLAETRLRPMAKKVWEESENARKTRASNFKHALAQAQRNDPTINIAMRYAAEENVGTRQDSRWYLRLKQAIQSEYARTRTQAEIEALPGQINNEVHMALRLIRDYQRNKIHFDSETDLMQIAVPHLTMRTPTAAASRATTESVDWAYVIPLGPLRSRILKTIHENDSNYHAGQRVAHLSTRNFWWYTKTQDLDAFINTCHVCQSGKRLPFRPATDTMGRTTSLPQERLKVWCFDTLHLPPASTRHKYLLVLMDAATAYTEAYPMVSCNGKTVSKILRDEFFPRYHRNLVLVSDRGSENSNKLVKDCVSQHNSEIHFGHSYHHNNNPVERINRCIGNIIRMKLTEQEWPKEKWPQTISTVLASMRATVDTSGSSAHARAYGVEPSTQADAIFGFSLLGEPEGDVRQITEIPPEFLPLPTPQLRSPWTREVEPQEERTIDDNKSFLVLEKTTRDGKKVQVTYMKLYGDRGTLSLVQTPNNMTFMPHIFAVNTRDDRNIHVNPDAVHSRAEALQRSKDQERQRRHRRNDRGRPEPWTPKTGELVDWLRAVDPNSRNSRKLARRHEGVYRICEMTHARAAKVQKFNMDTFEPVGPELSIIVNCLRPSTQFAHQIARAAREQSPADIRPDMRPRRSDVRPRRSAFSRQRLGPFPLREGQEPWDTTWNEDPGCRQQ